MTRFGKLIRHDYEACDERQDDGLCCECNCSACDDCCCKEGDQ